MEYRRGVGGGQGTAPAPPVFERGSQALPRSEKGLEKEVRSPKSGSLSLSRNASFSELTQCRTCTCAVLPIEQTLQNKSRGGMNPTLPLRSIDII